MPDGVVQWFDPSSGEATIVRAGRVFRARVADLEAVARRAGAHVHFDVRREQGVETAVEVQLRPGARASHRHHRFGALTGARGPDTKGPLPYAHVNPELARSGVMHPLEVVRAWATSLSGGDAAGASALYAPDAVLHVGEEPVTGRSALQAWLEASPLLGAGRRAAVRGADGEAIVTWAPSGPDERAVSVRCRFAHGELTEQWVEEGRPPEAPAVIETAAGALTIVMSAVGDVGEDAKAYAQDRVARLLEMLREPVLFARVKLAKEADPARDRRAVAQATLDVNGDLVRAHVAAHTMPEAVDRLQGRLRDLLDHRAQHRERLARSRSVAEPGEWRHGDPPAARPAYFERPLEERQLVRHKTFAVDELTPDEALFDMEQLDFDFYLFVDLASGADAMIERSVDGSYVLERLVAVDVDPGPTAVLLKVPGTAAPVLTVDEAIERLNAGGEPHVFFANAATGRGNVLYRRYDGHYGLIVPE